MISVIGGLTLPGRIQILDFYHYPYEGMRAVAQVNWTLGSTWIANTAKIWNNYATNIHGTNHFYVIKIPDYGIIGYIVARPDTPPNIQTYYISYLAIMKGFQGIGYGKLLFLCMINEVRMLGATVLKLDCREELLPVYESMYNALKQRTYLSGVPHFVPNKPYDNGAERYGYTFTILEGIQTCGGVDPDPNQVCEMGEHASEEEGTSSPHKSVKRLRRGGSREVSTDEEYDSEEGSGTVSR